MRSIETSIDIGASVERVWEIFADTAAYPEWNKMFLKLEGEWKVGGRLRLVSHPPGQMTITLPALIQDLEPGSLFRFRDTLFGQPWLMQGAHEFRLEPLAEGQTRFHHSEHVSGVLAPLIGPIIRASERGYQDMNEALKARAEASLGSPAAGASDH